MRLLYPVGIHCYGLFLRLAAWVHPKARKWVRGRQNWQGQLPPKGEQPWLWFHCASLGEFEQGRPVIEAIRNQYPHYQILLTFFSPSGYEVRKNYPQADHIAYLPLDTPRNAQKWVQYFRPALTFFIKYELWLNYLSALHQANCPTVLVSAQMRPESNFLRSPLRKLYRTALENLAHIFVQNEATLQLLQARMEDVQLTLSGDTRFDRVLATYERSEPLPEIADFVQGRVCIMGGSTWPKGEQLLLAAFARLRTEHKLCLILAPHEIRPAEIANQLSIAPEKRIAYSELEKRTDAHEILWIDNVGMLSRLYRHADIAYVGGGWGSGLHNILEPTVFGTPVIFGPVYDKFPEAEALIQHGGAFSIDSLESLYQALARLLADVELRKELHTQQRDFIVQQAGATQIILDWCQKARHLH